MMTADNIFSSESLNDDKADEIRFTGGKYVGKNGWLRRSKHLCGERKVYVLVDLGTNDAVKKTYVNIEYVDGRAGEPTSYMEALMQQHLNIETTMNDLCKKLARFDIRTRKAELLQEFATRLDTAVDRQEAMGRHANWKRVVFDEDGNMENA
jgi:hypothetical protein